MNPHWKSVMASVHNQQTSLSERSGGMHRQILHYLLHISCLRFGNTYVDIDQTLRSGISRLVAGTLGLSRQSRRRQDLTQQIKLIETSDFQYK